MNIIGHAIDEDPRRILVLYPTTGQAEKWSKETLDQELFEATPGLHHMVRGGRRDASNTILHKIFPGGMLNAFGGNAPGEMRRAKGNLLFADEIDALQAVKSDEGDQLDIFWMRGSEYPDAIKIAASYPSVTNQSRIAKLMEGSDFRKWFTPCKKCGDPVVLERDHIVHPAGKPELAEIEAPCCGRMLTDTHRRWMIARGEWAATQEFVGIRGFWGNGMMSPHPKQKGFRNHLHWIAQRQIDAETADRPDRAKRVIVNTFDALPYTPERIEAPEASELFKRREDYQPKKALPDGVFLITAGVDVQKEWIEVSIWGWGENKESWRLDHEKITGNVDDPKTWKKLDNFLGKCSFCHPLGVYIGLKTTIIDASHWTSTVTAWTAGKAGRRIFAGQGSPTVNAPIVTKSRVAYVKGTRRKVKIYPIGVNEAKEVIYSRLTLPEPDPGEDFPVGYIHFNEDCAESYFAGLTCEYGVEETRNGDTFTRFKNPPGSRNEPLDTYVYAMAARRLTGTPMGRIRKALEARAERENSDSTQPEQSTPISDYVGEAGNSWL